MQQTTAFKKRQIYLNTLAVYAVHTYLKWLGIDSRLEGDSWQPGNRVLFDVADLVLPGIGKLECRPVLSEQAIFHLPLEVCHDRIGYVAVQFDSSLERAELLGFIPGDPAIEPPEEIQLADLHSLEDLIDHIDWIESGKAIALRHWLEKIYHDDSGTIYALGWQEPAALIPITRSIPRTGLDAGSPEPIAHRAKRLEPEFAGQTLGLQLQLIPTPTTDLHIRVRLSPLAETSHLLLPTGVQLRVLDEQDNICMQEQAGEANAWIEHEFTGHAGEIFRIEVVLGDTKVAENFVI